MISTPSMKRRGQLGEPHHENGADGEVGGHDAVGRRRLEQRRDSSTTSTSAIPVVPTTAWTPWAAHQRMVAPATSATVKSTATSAPDVLERLDVAGDLDAGAVRR